jgi:hypothetical protein
VDKSGSAGPALLRHEGNGAGIDQIGRAGIALAALEIRVGCGIDYQRGGETGKQFDDLPCVSQIDHKLAALPRGPHDVYAPPPAFRDKRLTEKTCRTKDKQAWFSCAQSRCSLARFRPAMLVLRR